VSPKRVQMTRQRPWRADNPDAVIVARPSVWGNPFHVFTSEIVQHDDGRDWWAADGARRAAVDLFREEVAPGLDLASLAGRDLACWCPLDQPCHADVLLELSNGGTS
jgi:hypothetical protein